MAIRGAAVGVEALQVSYGRTRVLKGIDLQIGAGKFVALIGSSGCGKTTLLRAISGFISPDSGTITVDGRDVTPLPPESRGMAMVFQSYALWPHMTVAENIGYGLKLRGVNRADRDRKITDVLDLLRLQGYGDRKVTALSGGQRQRVALGRALAVDPPVLLLDEPLSNLDAKIRLAMRHELKSLHERLGLTAIHVTHDQEEAMTMADEIVILDAGEIAQKGAPEAIYRAPNSPFVAAFLGADNVLDAMAETAGSDMAIRIGEGPATSLPLRQKLEGRCHIHFRSHAVQLAAPPGMPGLRLRGTITQASYPGGTYRYEVETPAGRFFVDDTRRASPGDCVELTIPTEEMHIFPATTAPVRT
ncbi:MAG: ABC transporter ATP-binding protein [Beijerinckiaceae bacterium]|nr:ABC transporter ATP-binding protein [Beijerinckiaceae bacterium]